MARDKLEEARREGMAYALNIVKTKGIGGLEEECKFRGATKMPLALPKNAIDECVFSAVGLLCLFQEFIIYRLHP